MNNKKYNQIIDEAYENYLNNFEPNQCPPNLDVQPDYYSPMSKEWFIKSAKEQGFRGKEFSEKWGLNILETYDLVPHTEDFGDVTITRPIRKNKLIIVYKNEIIEIYE